MYYGKRPELLLHNIFINLLGITVTAHSGLVKLLHVNSGSWGGSELVLPTLLEVFPVVRSSDQELGQIKRE